MRKTLLFLLPMASITVACNGETMYGVDRTKHKKEHFEQCENLCGSSTYLTMEKCMPMCIKDLEDKEKQPKK